jgi:glutamate synthase (NADPH/NADH) small chain
MGRIGAFIKVPRQDAPERDPRERVGDFKEFVGTLPLVELREQGARCMECGVPFCHDGCPLGNLIPDWNDLVYRDRWEEAIQQLHRTNNFPEFTGRLCPAPCEAACVLEINEGNAVTIKQIEVAIVNRAWDEGWVVPQAPAKRTGRSVGVIGSGPAGLAAAQQLVAVGVEFVFGADGGASVEVAELRERHDALVLATGSRVPRDLPVPGRELDGVHFAMEYLYSRQRGDGAISASGKHVVVIGGGDTGADCVGHANRDGAASVMQIELLGEPPVSRPDELTPWPRWPMKLRTSYALKEGGDRDFAISTTALTGNGSVEQIHWQQNAGAPPFDLVPGTEETRPADLVLLAMGFLGPETLVLDRLGIQRDGRGNVDAPRYATSVDGVFAAGDARRGQSLIVWAINEGRKCAAEVTAWLDGRESAAQGATSLSIATNRRGE